MATLNFAEWLPDRHAITNDPILIDAKNVLSDADHYRPVPGLTETTSALTAACLGHAAARDKLQSAHMYAGDETKLYELEGTTWTDRSKTGGYTTATGTTVWRFAAYGDRMIAVNGLDAPQYIDMSTAATQFANLGGSPPTARFVATYGEFVFLGALSTNFMTIKWSSIGDSTGWTAGVGLSDEQELADGGPISGFAVTQAALYVFQEKCVRRVMFVGGDTIMQIDKLFDGIGCIEPNSLVQHGQRIFFLSEEGWYMFDGASEPTPIGLDKFDRWFLDESSRDSWYMMSTVIDPRNRVFACGFVSGAAARPDTILFYNYSTGRATYAKVTHERLVHARSLGVSLDDLTGDLDADYSISFDDPFWGGGAFYFGAFTTDHKLASFAGSNLAATLTFGPIRLLDGRRASVGWVKPVTDSASATVAGGYQVRPSDDVTYQAAVSQQASGRCPQRGVNGFYLTAKTEIPAATSWTWARGIEFDARAAGVR